ncbi:MAG: arginine-tRNA-protein transferase [Saprospiraceae bacterium]|nr:arginine-tRNA-protein transferase [Saprospiraceae bacterium]
MKFFLSEYRHDYSSYTFGYTIYAICESRSDLEFIYSNGFLPYTGNLEIRADIFYKSRGIRIVLDHFSDTSENRRVQRKIASFNIKESVIPIESFDQWDEFFDFAKKYSNVRIGDHKMPLERIKYISSRKYLTHIIQFNQDDKVIGYILVVISDSFMHFWFSFYDTTFLEQNIPLGKWLMWKCIHIAKAMDKSYIYLGNGYQKSSLYKTRDFKGVEYYNGNSWSSDLEKFQFLVSQDEALRPLDDFKLNGDWNQQIGSLL